MSTVFEYDAENKLVRVSSLDKTANYKYDGLGRRIEKEVTETGVTTTTRYIYDNEDILLELDGDNNITARYTHGPGIDEPLIMEKGSKSFFYHADGLGSITELTSTAGTVIQSYTYSSFGKIESQLDPNFLQPYTFTAREFDLETRLYFYRARYFVPATGRFLSEDPEALAVLIPTAINRYPYVLNNPVNNIDPNGKTAIAYIAGAVVAAAAIGAVIVFKNCMERCTKRQLPKDANACALRSRNAAECANLCVRFVELISPITGLLESAAQKAGELIGKQVSGS